MSVLFVGIDVSKDYSSSQGLDPEGKKAFYLEFPNEWRGIFSISKHGEEPLSESFRSHGSDRIHRVLPHQSVCVSLFGGHGLCDHQSSVDCKQEQEEPFGSPRLDCMSDDG